MRKYLLTTIIVFCSLFVFAQKEIIVSSSDKGPYVSHKVAAKESFYSIGRVYSVHPQEIAHYNQLDMAKGLNIGQTLKIPLASNYSQSVDKGTPVYYIVGEKEGLYRVSVKNGGVLMASLRKWNKLTSDNIKPGQKLIVGYIISAEDMAKAPLNSDQTEEKFSGEARIQEINQEGMKEVKEEAKKDQAIEEKKKDPPVVTEARPIQANRTATNDGAGGYFRTAFEHQARSISINKEQTATSGVFKTSSGWDDAKYYILIDKVEPGTIVKVTNPSNNKTVYAKVLEGMSGIRQNAGLDVRISNAAASILDVTETDKFIVKVTY